MKQNTATTILVARYDCQPNGIITDAPDAYVNLAWDAVNNGLDPGEAFDGISAAICRVQCGDPLFDGDGRPVEGIRWEATP